MHGLGSDAKSFSPRGVQTSKSSLNYHKPIERQGIWPPGAVSHLAGISVVLLNCLHPLRFNFTNQICLNKKLIDLPRVAIELSNGLFRQCPVITICLRIPKWFEMVYFAFIISFLSGFCGFMSWVCFKAMTGTSVTCRRHQPMVELYMGTSAQLSKMWFENLGEFPSIQ